MSEPTRRRITRNQLVQRWGTPQETSGSVNEPRTHEEHGIRFNEKWIYRRRGDDPREPRQRTIYWDRYDFVASYVVTENGTVEREDEAPLVADLDDRLYLPQRSSNASS